MNINQVENALQQVEKILDLFDKKLEISDDGECLRNMRLT